MMMIKCYLIFCIFVIFSSIYYINHNNKYCVYLENNNQTICGKLSYKNQVVEFLGIPFAKPPIKNLRFEKPVPLLQLPRNPFDAFEYGNPCPQYVYGDIIKGDEDCLTLNIFVPISVFHANNIKILLPVMNFIYGGAFITGSSSIPLYNGTKLVSEHDIILCTFNYRLSSLGFLPIEELHIKPNLGIYDQQLAMIWIKKNIHFFHGDSNRITLFGESAGAMSTGLHLFSIPSSKTLFSAAIMQSYSFALPFLDKKHHAKSQYEGTSDHTINGFRRCLCTILNLPVEKTKFTKKQLQELPMPILLNATNLYVESEDNDIIAASRLKEFGWAAFLAFSPMIDNEFIMSQPWKGYYFHKDMVAKPFMLGSNRNESVLFFAINTDMKKNIFHRMLQSVGYDVMIDILFGIEQSKEIRKISLYNVNKVEGYETYNGNKDLSAWSNVLNDMGFQCSNLLTAEMALKQVNNNNIIYLYQFTELPSDGFVLLTTNYGICKPCSGVEKFLKNVCHAAELSYVFNTLDFTFPNVTPSFQVKELSAKISQLWTDFAKYHSIPKQFQWKMYNNTNRFVYNLGNGWNSMKSQQYQVRNCDLWSRVFPYNQKSGKEIVNNDKEDEIIVIT